jgi:uncharacterized membrane protein YeaQ/YmgE (transglycosylase-associated protein family)
MRGLDPAITFLLVLVIGAVAGILFDRVAGPGWLSRQVSGARRGQLTSALVGIAGAFIGFHLESLVLRTGGIVAALIAAALGAALVLWIWRTVR